MVKPGFTIDNFDWADEDDESDKVAATTASAAAVETAFAVVTQPQLDQLSLTHPSTDNRKGAGGGKQGGGKQGGGKQGGGKQGGGKQGGGKQGGGKQGGKGGKQGGKGGKQGGGKGGKNGNTARSHVANQRKKEGLYQCYFSKIDHIPDGRNSTEDDIEAWYIFTHNGKKIEYRYVVHKTHGPQIHIYGDVPTIKQIYEFVYPDDIEAFASWGGNDTEAKFSTYGQTRDFANAFEYAIACQ